MTNKPVDIGTVLAMKTRARAYPDLGKIVTRRKVATMTGGIRIVRVSLPAISMHIAALGDAGRPVRRAG